MVGVFDPKMEPGVKSSRLNRTLSISALALMVGIAGFGGFVLLQSGTKTDTSAKQTSLALKGSGKSSPGTISTEAPLILTSFQTLEPIADTEIRTETLQRGDTLTDLMDRLGVSRSEANSALYSLYDSELIDARKVRPGLEVSAHIETAATEEDPEAVRLAGLTLKHAREASLVVTRSSDGSYSAHELHTKLLPKARRVTGTVQTTLYEAALEAGAHDAQVYDFAQIFAYDVDFQREMRVGDRFEMVFEEYTDERGRYISGGNLLFAELDGNAVDRGFYRFTPSDDEITDYYDLSGESARKFLMKTPINGARLSSGFGRRTHPISGYSRMHKGTDFAAPSGTPIMAAGNGVVERASRFGTYGNYARIRHANGYATAYAHMLRYGPGVKSGVRIKQGDIIGYVGSTGASTGPHLHYEVLKGGKQVNAMSLNLPTGRKLEGKILKEFAAARDEIDQIRGTNETETLFAASSSEGVAPETDTSSLE